jgi:hypothetical protein
LVVASGACELKGELFLLLHQNRIQERELDLLLGERENNAGGAVTLAHLGQGREHTGGAHGFLISHHHPPC